jgi:hypothetical protein
MRRVLLLPWYLCQVWWYGRQIKTCVHVWVPTSTFCQKCGRYQ